MYWVVVPMVAWHYLGGRDCGLQESQTKLKFKLGGLSNALPRSRCFTRCPRCGDEENNSCHALWMCPAAREVWWNSALRLVLDSYKGGPISALCLHIVDNGRGDEVAIFCMLLWSIWFDRNRWVFEGKCDSPEEVFSRASRLLGHFYLQWY